jgi:hypothetical protein
MKKKSDRRAAKPQKEAGKPLVLGNKRLALQTRKLLGKHYASKYRSR